MHHNYFLGRDVSSLWRSPGNKYTYSFRYLHRKQFKLTLNTFLWAASKFWWLERNKRFYNFTNDSSTGYIFTFVCRIFILPLFRVFWNNSGFEMKLEMSLKLVHWEVRTISRRVFRKYFSACKEKDQCIQTTLR